MSKLKTSAAVILLLVIGATLLLMLSRRTGTVRPVTPANTSSAQARLSPVDLTAFYDKDPSFDAPGCWQAVPRGLQTIAGLPFNIAGLIQLWGEGPAGMGRNYRQRVEGIPLSGKFQTLYVLHGASFITAQGTPIAQVVFRYADGSSATNLIRYGFDSRDWWEPLSEPEPLPANSASQVVWRGDHQSLPDWVKALRLFGTAIPNPHPQAEVKTLDLFSTKSRTTWVVLAMTTGPAGRMRVDAGAELPAEVPAKEVTLTVSSVDRESGQSIPNMRFSVSLWTRRRPRPYGIFSADQQGQALITLPPVHIKLLSIETISSDYTPEQMTWNLEKGEILPTNYVFKVSK